jgi:hypothetical protein
MNKNCTDIKQSMKLMEILPLESADAYYIRKIADFMGNSVDGKWGDPKFGNPQQADYIIQNFTSYETIPAWSLVALLDILPFPQLSKDKLGSGKIGWMVSVFPDNCRSDSHWHKNPIDACYEMIINLKELKLL